MNIYNDYKCTHISNKYTFIHTQIWLEIRLRYVTSGSWMAKSPLKERWPCLFSNTGGSCSLPFETEPHTVALAGLDPGSVLLSGCLRWKAWGTGPGCSELWRPVGTSGKPPHERAWWAGGTACGVCTFPLSDPSVGFPSVALGNL